jgi:hypothetical protein
MLKAMLFVDADWLCASTLDLGRAQGKPDLQLDHRRLRWPTKSAGAIISGRSMSCAASISRAGSTSAMRGISR